MEELQRLGATIIVPGHGERADTGLPAVTHEYLTVLRSETKRLAAEGHTADEIITIVTPQLQSRYPDWDTSDMPWRIASGVQTFLSQ